MNRRQMRILTFLAGASLLPGGSAAYTGVGEEPRAGLKLVPRKSAGPSRSREKTAR